MSIVSIKDIIKNNYKLSPNNYINKKINSDFTKPLEEFVEKIEKGTEIGTQNYVNSSEYHFLRTSAFTEEMFSVKIDNNSYIDINPNTFLEKKLKKEDILICKDSNVGEVVILDKDLENTMFSAGINKIEFKRNSKYFYAVMKNKNFKEQLNSLIPKGSTLKHAKDLYLKCKVPYINESNLINYIENMVEIIIHKEKIIKDKKIEIDKYINKEINENQNEKVYTYKFPKVDEMLSVNRLDTGVYTANFKEIDFKIKNYKNGYYTINPKNIKGRKYS